MPDQRIFPVLLSGGSGTRLWPLSSEDCPKQFLSLISDRTMLQETAIRITGDRFFPPLVVCSEAHRFIVAEQLRAIGIKPSRIVLEPAARNTAPAVALAALTIADTDPDGLMLILPADHVIQDSGAFLDTVEVARAAADARLMVTFGVTPTRVETGYGYIRKGAPLPSATGSFRVAAFVEKPPHLVAERLVADGAHLWNAGMFLFPVRTLLAELERHAPAVLTACRRALARGAAGDLDFRRLDAEAFAAAPAISIDHAVMERTTCAAVVPLTVGWTDVGAWSALWEIAGKDADGNVAVGRAILEDVRNSYVRSAFPLVALLGVKDLVVIATDDAILVADRSKVQDVKRIVERLAPPGRAGREHLDASEREIDLVAPTGDDIDAPADA